MRRLPEQRADHSATYRSTKNCHRDTGHNRHSPGAGRLGDSARVLAAVSQLFAEGSDRPCACHRRQQHRVAPVQRSKSDNAEPGALKERPHIVGACIYRSTGQGVESVFTQYSPNLTELPPVISCETMLTNPHVRGVKTSVNHRRQDRRRYKHPAFRRRRPALAGSSRWWA